MPFIVIDQAETWPFICETTQGQWLHVFETFLIFVWLVSPERNTLIFCLWMLHKVLFQGLNRKRKLGPHFSTGKLSLNSCFHYWNVISSLPCASYSQGTTLIHLRSWESKHSGFFQSGKGQVTWICRANDEIQIPHCSWSCFQLRLLFITPSDFPDFRSTWCDKSVCILG